MKILKRIVSLITIIFLINNVSIGYSKKSHITVSAETRPAKVSAFFNNFTDDYVSLIREELKNIQKENPDKVQYTFYDANENQAKQYEQIQEVINEGTDLILLNIVDRAYAKQVIDRIKENNIPLILFNREPLTPVPIQSYSKALFVGTDGESTGKVQGEMLVDIWNSSREYVDKNKDGIMQYFMLRGEVDNMEAIKRTKYSISTIEKSGIETQEVSLSIANWKEDLAYNATKSVFEKYEDSIEVIISNDDTMAIGAMKALQEYGYNKGDKSKTIPIVGVDVTPAAKEFIEKGYMLGSVYQYPRDYAETMYITGMNLIAKKNSIEGTKYKFDDTLVSIRTPDHGFLYNNIFIK